MRKAALALGFVCVLAGWGSMAAAGEEAEKPIEPKEKTVLFDGKSFEGWHRQLFRDGDVDKTWQIKDGGILYCSGRPAGYVRTAKAYRAISGRSAASGSTSTRAAATACAAATSTSTTPTTRRSPASGASTRSGPSATWFAPT